MTRAREDLRDVYSNAARVGGVSAAGQRRVGEPLPPLAEASLHEEWLGPVWREPPAESDEPPHRRRHEQSELDQADEATNKPAGTHLVARDMGHPGHETNAREDHEHPPGEASP